MSPSPATILITTINVVAVLVVLYWARFLVKHMKENTEFADLLLQHERVEADTKPLGMWKAGADRQRERESHVVRQNGPRTVRSGGGRYDRVLRNIDVWKRAKYGASRAETGQELGVHAPVAVAEEVVPVDSSGEGVRQRRRTVRFSPT